MTLIPGGGSGLIPVEGGLAPRRVPGVESVCVHSGSKFPGQWIRRGPADTLGSASESRGRSRVCSTRATLGQVLCFEVNVYK